MTEGYGTLIEERGTYDADHPTHSHEHDGYSSGWI